MKLDANSIPKENVWYFRPMWMHEHPPQLCLILIFFFLLLNNAKRSSAAEDSLSSPIFDWESLPGPLFSFAPAKKTLLFCDYTATLCCWGGITGQSIHKTGDFQVRGLICPHLPCLFWLQLQYHYTGNYYSSNSFLWCWNFKAAAKHQQINPPFTGG